MNCLDLVLYMGKLYSFHFLFYFFKIGLISPKLTSGDDLKLFIFLHPLPKCWHCRCALTLKVSSILRIKTRTLNMAGRHCTQLLPQIPRETLTMLWLCYDLKFSFGIFSQTTEWHVFLENIPRSVSSYNSASKLTTWALLPTCSCFISRMKRKNKNYCFEWCCWSIDWLASSF